MAGNIYNNTVSSVSNLESDAVPELEVLGDQVTSSNEDAASEFNILMKPCTQETAVNRDAVATNQTHKAQDDKPLDFLPYLKYFPENLKTGHIDILIVNTKSDHKGAKNLKECIEKEVNFCDGLTPNVVLLDDIYTPFSYQRLNEAYSRSHFVFLYVTNNFCKNSFKLSQSYSFLAKALQTQDISISVIPVYTCPKEQIRCELPMMLDDDDLKELNTYDGTLMNEVTVMLEKKSHLILDNRFILREKQRIYFHENFDNIMSKEKHFYGKSQSRQFVEDQMEVRRVDTEMQQQMSQCSVSSEEKSFMGEDGNSSLIEPDGDVSRQSKKTQQNAEKKYNGSQFSSDCIKKVTNESNYYTPEVKVPVVNYTSLPESEGDKAVPFNLPSLIHSSHAQGASCGVQSWSDSARTKSHADSQLTQKHDSENSKDSSTYGSHTNKNTKEKLTKSSSKSTRIYNINIKHADFVSMNSDVKVFKSGNKKDIQDDTSDDDSSSSENEEEDQ